MAVVCNSRPGSVFHPSTRPAYCKMADDSTKLSPHLGMRKKRSVQFLVDCHLQEAESIGGGPVEASGYCSCHEGDNISVRSTGSTHRTVVCPIRSASPRPSSGTVDSVTADEDEDGSPITISRPPDAPEDLAIFEIGLGMLRQHTIYEVQFLLPATGRLNSEDVEIARTNVVLPQEGRHFERAADVEVIRIDFFKNDGVYKLTMKMTTCAMPHLFESFVLRETLHHENCVYFMLRGNALGKGHGTPSLRLGIHQVGHTAEYEGSDGKTEPRLEIDVNRHPCHRDCPLLHFLALHITSLLSPPKSSHSLYMKPFMHPAWLTL
ncbi:expressed conserved protein [Echinococcus multilocularis]|uniref:Adipose-secreted signaling protein n=1 Tax=Echinococcus multilocularis TaxID=6211 RepID=A0A068YHR0_ECHMU|nr:expressed conserved protein [Echinococcus multilocularis]